MEKETGQIERVMATKQRKRNERMIKSAADMNRRLQTHGSQEEMKETAKRIGGQEEGVEVSGARE